MSSITFDTLKYTKQLEQSGFTREQAEAQATAQKQSLSEALEDVASKSDVNALKKDSDIYKSDIASVKTELTIVKTDLAVVKTELAVVKWMVGTAIFGILMLLIKAFM
jgi:predicted  nucleic acid-binding Zn-ribbon protein